MRAGGEQRLVIPLTIAFPGTPGPNPAEVIIELASLLSPASLVFMNEINQLREFDVGPWWTIAINFTLYGACLVAIRRVCIVHAHFRK